MIRQQQAGLACVPRTPQHPPPWEDPNMRHMTLRRPPPPPPPSRLPPWPPVLSLTPPLAQQQWLHAAEPANSAHSSSMRISSGVQVPQAGTTASSAHSSSMVQIQSSWVSPVELAAVMSCRKFNGERELVLCCVSHDDHFARNRLRQNRPCKAAGVSRDCTASTTLSQEWSAISVPHPAAISSFWQLPEIRCAAMSACQRLQLLQETTQGTPS